MAHPDDVEIVCQDCTRPFVWTVGEQKFYGKRGYARPKRCKSCCKERRVGREKNEAERLAAASAAPTERRDADGDATGPVDRDGEATCPIR